jgi:hypothetical protein
MGFYEDEEMWEKNWDKSTKNLVNNYKKAFQDVLLELISLIGMENSELSLKKQREILLFITQVITELEKQNQDWVEDEIAKAFILGQAATLMQIGIAKDLKTASKTISESGYKKYVLDAVISDTMEDLLAATENTDKRTKKMVRDVFSEVMKQQRIQNKGRKTIEKEVGQILSKKIIEEQMKKNAFIGIVDKSGRKWQLEKYISMAVRTKILESYRQGVITEALERGIDTVYISVNNAKDDCVKFEGILLSLTGATPNLPRIDDLRRTYSNSIFHPNCKHQIRVIRNLDLLPDNVKALNKKNRKNISKIL